jgi:iron(II)-dependent oxidoreductase
MSKEFSLKTRIMIYFLIFLFLPGCERETPENRLISIPAGWFLMGENSGPRSNQPQRRVYLDEFHIQQHEVTREKFAEFLTQTGFMARYWQPDDLIPEPDHPVTKVLWEEAAAYCEWLGMRLPTEAEWEKAARGTGGWQYPWGNEWKQNLANTAAMGIGGTMPPGSFPDGASPYGVWDMVGNAAEWVSDYFSFDYYTNAPDRNPAGPDTILDHVVRGGSWDSPKDHAQTFFRDSSHCIQPNPRIGFRCAASPEN